MRTISRVLLILALPLLGAWLFVAGWHGQRPPWQRLSQPPSNVTALTARNFNVYATLTDGTLYSMEWLSDCTGNCWRPVDAIPLLNAMVGEGCEPPPLAGDFNLVTMICTVDIGGLVTTAYALGSDGYVWMWRYGQGGELAPLFDVGVPCLGAIVGLGLLLLLWLARNLNRRARQKLTPPLS